MSMSTMEDILNAISKSDRSDEEKADLMDVLQAKMISITSYVGTVARIKMQMQLYAGTEDAYMAGKADEQLASARENCRKCCIWLNRMCEDLQIEPFCDSDIEDREKLDEFCRQTAMRLYSEGIRK